MKAFVTFYQKLLKYHKQLSNPFIRRNFLHRSTGRLISYDTSTELLDMILDLDVPIIFCINGADCVDAWTVLKQQIRRICEGNGNISTIQGHQVILIYCRSEDMIRMGSDLTNLSKAQEAEKRIEEAQEAIKKRAQMVFQEGEERIQMAVQEAEKRIQMTV